MLVKSLFLCPSNRWRSRDLENRIPRSSEVNMVPKKVSVGRFEHSMRKIWTRFIALEQLFSSNTTIGQPLKLFWPKPTDHFESVLQKQSATIKLLIWNLSSPHKQIFINHFFLWLCETHTYVRRTSAGVCGWMVWVSSVCVCLCLRYTLITRYVCQRFAGSTKKSPCGRPRDKAPFLHISRIYLTTTKVLLVHMALTGPPQEKRLNDNNNSNNGTRNDALCQK